MSDIMDEFEFKPLTEGLGFHNKSKKPEMPPAAKVMESPLPRITAAAPPLGTIPRRPSVSPGFNENLPTTTVDEILKTLNAKKRPEIVNNTNEKKIVTYLPA